MEKLKLLPDPGRGRESELRTELHALVGEHWWQYIGFDVAGLVGEVHQCRVCGKLKNVRGPGY